MKLAIAGKGGVGKTTLSSLLARLYSSEGKAVIAIDANPDANLAAAVGVSPEEARKIVPIVELHELIEERTGAKPGSSGAYFRLNPRVDDLPESYAGKRDNVKVMVMGTVKTGGGGCMCPESTMVKSLITHLLVGRTEEVVVDMDAGVEHLGRGTAQAVDAFIVVVEPGQRSFQTAHSVKKLAQDLGIKKVWAVGSKTKSEADRQFIRDSLPDFDILGYVNYHPEIAQADVQGKSAFDLSPEAVQEVRQIRDSLAQLVGEGGRK